MPSSIQIAAFIFGSVLLLLALVGGNIKIFGAEIPDRASKPIRIFSGILGMLFIGIGLLASFINPTNFQPTATSETAPNATSIFISPTPNIIISTNTPQSKSSPTTEETNNVLVIEINGEQKTYAGSDFDFLMNLWYSELQSNKYSSSDSLTIKLPAQVQAGEIIQIKPSTSTFNIARQSIVYIGKNGKSYDAMLLQGSYIEIRIDTWEGRGGMATGSIEGEIRINQVDTITFSNGKFRIRIKPNGL